MTTPSILYKYKAFSPESMELILADYLYFADPAQFNDPLDCKVSVVDDIGDEVELKSILYGLYRQKAEKQLIEAASKLHYQGPKTIEKITFLSDTQAGQQVMGLYHDFNCFNEGESSITQALTYAIGSVVLSGYNRGILSLAENSDCPLMWSHYADNHKGLCLGYEIPNDVKDDIKSINYTSDSREISTSQIRSMLYDDSYDKNAVEEAIFLRKASPWSYEKEWRMISTVGLQNSRLNLSEITFGLRCKSTTIFSVMKSLQKRDLPVKFYQIKEIPKKFTLAREELTFDDEEIIFLPRCLEYTKQLMLKS